MPRLEILSKPEQREFDSPPLLSGEVRKSIFRIDSTNKKYIETIGGQEHSVAYLLMYNYFRLTRKFFLPQDFITKDIEYVCRQLGLYGFIDAESLNNLSKSNLKRYREKILERSGFEAFDVLAKELLYEKSQKLAANHVKPKIIFNDCIELLLNQKIEVPKYFAVSEIIRAAMVDYKKNVLKLLADILRDEQRILLDDLLCHSDDKKIYKLTAIKSFNHSVRPKAIRENVYELNKVREIYNCLLPLIQKLPLSFKGIEYFATTVMKSDIFRMKRKSDNDKYLHLITFVIYQYSIMHDALMDIFLKAIGSFNSSSKREHQIKCYEERTSLQENLKKYFFVSQKENIALRAIRSLYMDNSKDAFTKLKEIGKILDELYKSNIIPSTSTNFDNIENLISANKPTEYSDILSEKSRALQVKLSPILKSLCFDYEQSSCHALLKATDYFGKVEGKIPNILPTEPLAFLDNEDKSNVVLSRTSRSNKNETIQTHSNYRAKYKINVPLYKALLFKYVATNVRSGSLNFEASYKYKALDEYLVPKAEWVIEGPDLIKQAGLEKFTNCDLVLFGLENVISQEYTRTNENIKSGANQFIKFKKVNDYTLKTPALDKKDSDITPLTGYFPDPYKVPMQEVLFTVNEASGFLDCFEYYKTTHKRESSRKLLVAGVMSLGYGMRDNEIAHISKNIKSSALENVVNWCFTNENIQNAIDSILRTTDATTVPQIYQDKDKKVHTASDGQKWKVVHDSLNANYSFKYYGQDQGVSVISFIDKRHLLFYSTVMSASLRESAYVIDGLMHNDVVKSEIHSTDSHGYSESVFAISHFLGIFAAPRIKNLKKQVLSMFPGYRSKYKDKKYMILY